MNTSSGGFYYLRLSANLLWTDEISLINFSLLPVYLFHLWPPSYLFIKSLRYIGTLPSPPDQIIQPTFSHFGTYHFFPPAFKRHAGFLTTTLIQMIMRLKDFFFILRSYLRHSAKNTHT